MDSINTFEINKTWFSYVAENINVKPIHTALYFFIFNKWNSLFWKKHFGLPTDNTMECMNIRSYKTYIKTLNELESFGFIKLIERSKNQNTSNIIEVVNNTKAEIKATTKAMLKATTQSNDQSEGQSNVSVVKHFNKEQLNLLTKNHIKVKEFLKTLNSESFSFKQSLLDLEIEEEIVSDWLKVRAKKKAANTKTAFTALIKQFELSGLSENDCIKQSVENSWSGFKADWLKNDFGKPKVVDMKIQDHYEDWTK